MPDRFSEDEARRIFARAAERQQAAEPASEGLSLAELQEVGRAAGLDPSHVAAAVAEVRGGVVSPDAPPATFLGVDVEPRASRVLPAEVTDDVWGQMVGRLRPTFKTIGVTSEVGAVREWQGTNERGGLSNLCMTAEPAEGGTLVTLQTSKAGNSSQYRAIFGVFGAMAVFFAVLGTLQGGAGDPAFWVFIGAFVASAVGFPLLGRQSYARWSVRRQDQFDALLDQFELLARDAAPPERRPAHEAEDGAGRLDLGAPDAPPEPDADRPVRRRSRA